METMELLDTHLEKGKFREAVSLTLKTLLKESRLWVREAAWDRITRPGYGLIVENVTVKGCPFLLGCLQAVKSEEGKLLKSWQDNLREDCVASFLEQGEPLLALYNSRAILASAEAAIAANRNDVDALLRHGYFAVHWFNGVQPAEILDQSLITEAVPSFLARSAVEGCFSILAERLDIPVGRARDLTQWFSHVAEYRKSLRKQRIMVPFYQGPRGGVATLEMELIRGSREFYADPVTMAFVQWNPEFKNSYENAYDFIHRLDCWSNDTDVRWCFHSDPPLFSLTGGSAGGAFFAGLWHLLTGTLSDLSVTISAGINADGLVLPVDHIQRKLDAVLEVPELAEVVVSEQQDGVEDQYGRLRVWKVGYAANS